MILTIIIGMIVVAGLGIWMISRATREREEINRIALSGVRVVIPHGLPVRLKDKDLDKRSIMHKAIIKQRAKEAR